jgi:hypothetical protein
MFSLHPHLQSPRHENSTFTRQQLHRVERRMMNLSPLLEPRVLPIAEAVFPSHLRLIYSFYALPFYLFILCLNVSNIIAITEIEEARRIQREVATNHESSRTQSLRKARPKYERTKAAEGGKQLR